jgi:hypothetical protein
VSARIEFRPRSASELVDASFQVLRRGYLPLVTIMAIAYVPWLIVVMTVTRAVLLGAGDVSARLGQTFTMMMLFSAGALVWFALIDGAMTAAASDGYLGHPIDIGSALRRMLSRAASLLGAAILRGLAIGIGFLFLFVPGVYFWAKYFAAPIAVVLEGRGPLEAMGRSSVLTGGEKWRVLRLLILVWGIYFVIGFAIQIVMSIFGASAADPRSPIFLVAQVVGALFTVLTYPLVAVAQTLLYYDLRIRKEGYDIELMAQQMGGDALGAGGAGDRQRVPAF